MVTIERPPADGYPFPPITEAVIEFRLKAELDVELQQQISTKLRSYYPNSTETTSRTINVDVSTRDVSVDEGRKTFRLSSEGEDQVCLVGPASLATCQLAPYRGWGEFIAQVKRDWDTFKAQAGYRKLERIGVRFINRLDLPFDEGSLRPEDYLKVYIQAPDEFGLMVASALEARHHVPKLSADLVLRSVTAESPLPLHLGIMLDIDVGRTLDVPQKDEDIFSYLQDVRVFKNSVFEGSITEKTQKRFFYDLRIGS